MFGASGNAPSSARGVVQLGGSKNNQDFPVGKQRRFVPAACDSEASSLFKKTTGVTVTGSRKDQPGADMKVRLDLEKQVKLQRKQDE